MRFSLPCNSWTRSVGSNKTFSNIYRRRSLVYAQCNLCTLELFFERLSSAFFARLRYTCRPHHRERFSIFCALLLLCFFLFSFYSAKCPHATPPAWIHIIFRLSSQEKSEEKWRFISLFRSFLLFSVRIVDEDSTRWFDYSISFSHHHGSGGCKRKERQRYDT